MLGCTHFPLLAGAIARQLGDPPRRGFRGDHGARHRQRSRPCAAADGGPGTSLMATDSPERFARVGARFLGSSIAKRAVEAIDL